MSGSSRPLRVLRVYPGANDPRHRQRDLALRRAGIEVGLVLPDRYGSDWQTAPVEPELPHWRSSLLNHRSTPLHLWSPRLLATAVRDFDPDIVDVHEEPFFPAGAQAVLAAGDRTVVAYTAQNLMKPLPIPILAMQRWVLGRIHGVYGTSSGAVDVVRKRGFRGPAKVIPIGVDPELFEARPRGERIGFIGRLVPQKGVADLLQFGHRLLCVGQGPMSAHVIAAGGEVRRASSIEELKTALEEMAVLVAPSRTTAGWVEQFGRMVVEGMAAGVPVVAYATGSLPEVVGEAGVLVAEGDLEGLVRAVDRAVEERERYASLGRRRVRETYTWDAVASQMVGLYEAARGEV